MRLHRLTLSAFGPFAGTESVDFDDLSAAGLFLLHGPTGAGKTSVLDAVCFALYGQVPGARPATRLRSDHAAPGTPTEVVLELTVAGRRLEITRRPEQPRAKRRGTGTTTDRAVTRLRERGQEGAWRGLSTSHQEIGEEVRQLVGMSCEQFCQVVLLPQGEFATFLRATATERATLLGRLFDTRRFKAAEEWLRERKHEAARALEDGERELGRLAARMRQAAGEEGEPGGDAPDLAAWAAVLRCDARERHAIAASAAASAEATYDAAARDAIAARDLHALQARHHRARERADALERDRPARDRTRTALARAQRAAAVEAALELRAKAAAQHTEAAERAERALAALAAAGEGPSRAAPAPAAGGAALPAQRAAVGPVASGERRGRAAGTGEAVRAAAPHAGTTWSADELARRAGELREELGALAAAREAEARLAEVAARRTALGQEDREDEAEARDAQEWLDRWPARRTELQAEVDAGLEGAARAARLAAEVGEARKRADAAAERDRLAGEFTRAQDEVRDARDRAANAREAWQDLREARITGIAAELAAGLVAGEPCRVCGAVEHPAPASTSGPHVTRAAEDAAYADFQRLEATWADARDRSARLRSALDAARALAGDTGQSELAAAHAALAAEQKAAADRADALARARADLARAEAERDRRAALLSGALNRTAARTSRREELDAQYAQSAAELDRARAGHAGVEDRRNALAAHIAVLERAAHAVRDRAAAAARLTEAAAALADAAARAGFGSADEAAAALLPAERLWETERRVEDWAKEEAAVEAELAAPEPAAAAALPPADPWAAQAALDAAGRALRDASATVSAAGQRCAELDRLSALLADRMRELAPGRVQFELARHLSDLASATTPENTYRMELETYVLAARLEQVAAAAGVRLHRMSGGRYTLVHTDARSGGRGKSGLGLRVVDAWTGTERDTATLSGGESFFASLALALGLADVVTGEAGGARLDTLFIDEGFGSLDDQSLDEVLDVLDGLRERDRAVGIVSHVADLRHRIPAQLRVDKRRDGSVLRQRGVAG